MPELASSQASGLLGLAKMPAPQLLAMVSLGDVRVEMPVLWQLCAALTALDCAVTVLDATAMESERAPGLHQFLQGSFVPSPPQAAQPQWRIMPAARAFQTLRSSAQLRAIGHRFSPDSTLLLYAGPDLLVQVLADSPVRPLLCACREKNSILTSYLALKRLLQQGRLEPTILNMMDTLPQPNAVKQHPVPDTLSVCARNFLGYEVRSITIESTQAEPLDSSQARQLAMRLLENVLLLGNSMAYANAHAAASVHGFMSRSH